MATMRMPRGDVLPPSQRLRILTLAVSRPESIRQSVAVAGPIDVLVHNAEIGLLSIVDSTSTETTREAFETNIFGTMAMTQAMPPEFPQEKLVSSWMFHRIRHSKRYLCYPCRTRAKEGAVNAFTESRALELAQFSVQVRLMSRRCGLPGRRSRPARHR